jgi:hypothetical protein
MPQAQSFYDKQAALIRWFVMARIGQDLRERYQAEELPPKVVALVRKLDDSDWLFPSINWDKDVDLFAG